MMQMDHVQSPHMQWKHLQERKLGWPSGTLTPGERDLPQKAEESTVGAAEENIYPEQDQ